MLEYLEVKNKINNRHRNLHSVGPGAHSVVHSWKNETFVQSTEGGRRDENESRDELLLYTCLHCSLTASSSSIKVYLLRA